MRAGGGALVGATFRRRADREAFAQAFGGAAPVVFVECVTPADVLARCATRRDRGERAAPDATLAVVVRQRTTWEPLDEGPGDAHVIISSDRAVERLVAELVGLLVARLWRAALA
jgi:predicted kinase